MCVLTLPHSSHGNQSSCSTWEPERLRTPLFSRHPWYKLRVQPCGRITFRESRRRPLALPWVEGWEVWGHDAPGWKIIALNAELQKNTGETLHSTVPAAPPQHQRGEPDVFPVTPPIQTSGHYGSSLTDWLSISRSLCVSLSPSKLQALLVDERRRRRHNRLSQLENKSSRQQTSNSQV